MQSSTNNNVTIITPPDHSFIFEKNILAVDLTGQQQKDLLNWAFDQSKSTAIWTWNSNQAHDEVWLLNASKLADSILINATKHCGLSTYLVGLDHCSWLESSQIDHSILRSISNRSLISIDNLDK